MIRVAKRRLEQDAVHWIATEGSILIPATRAVVITIGIELKSQGRWSNNWRAAAGRSRQLRERTMLALSVLTPAAVQKHLGAPVQQIGFTRLAPRMLDDDNLRTAAKAVRDQVVAWLAGYTTVNARANDGMRSGYTFSYYQQQQRLYGVRLELAA
jgi:hypothetical protein